MPTCTATHTTIEGSTRTIYTGDSYGQAEVAVLAEVGHDCKEWTGTGPDGAEAVFFARRGEAREGCQVWRISMH